MTPATTGTRQPTYALSHGGGPWPWTKGLMPNVDWTPLERSLQGIPDELPTRPRAALVVSAHWETTDFTVQTSPRPPMLYDYYGFPDFTYEIEYPAPGSPELADEVATLLGESGFATDRDSERGFDHGTFCTMYPIYPEADMAVVQLSIRADFDAAAHLEAGRALRSLRNRGVLILGSGLPSFHDLARFGSPAATEPSAAFDAWLTETMVESVGSERSERLRNWYEAPIARDAHPRPDHFIPLLVAVGAAEDEPAVRHYHQRTDMMSVVSSAYRLGGADNRPS